MIKYKSILLAYNTNTFNILYLNDPSSDHQRLVMYNIDTDTLFFLHNSYYMDYRENPHTENFSTPHNLIYSEGQL